MSRYLQILRIGRWVATEGMVIGALAVGLFALVTVALALLNRVLPHRLTELGYLIPGLILTVVVLMLAVVVGGALGSLLGLLFGGISGIVLGVCLSRTRPIILGSWRIALVCLATTLTLELVVLALLGADVPPAPLTFDAIWAWLALTLPIGCALWGSYRLSRWPAYLARSEY